MYAFRPALTSHISCVHVPVNAIGKKSKSVFLCPKLSLSRICFGPSGTLAGNVKSGALVPTASGINNPPVRVSREKFTIRSTCKWSKGLRRNCGHRLTRIHTDTSRDWEEVLLIEHPCFVCVHPWLTIPSNGTLLVAVHHCAFRRRSDWQIGRASCRERA